jgi:ribosomal protein S5
MPNLLCDSSTLSHSRGEYTIKVDRDQKPERGNSTVRSRALVIGRNGNGAASFDMGKALPPNKAIVKACKHCKRNIFYVDWHINSGLSYNFAGKHNSCQVSLRAVSPDYGLHGHPLIVKILKYSGVSNTTGKSHGNQNPYNVVSPYSFLAFDLLCQKYLLQQLVFSSLIICQFLCIVHMYFVPGGVAIYR